MFDRLHSDPQVGFIGWHVNVVLTFPQDEDDAEGDADVSRFMKRANAHCLLLQTLANAAAQFEGMVSLSQLICGR